MYEINYLRFLSRAFKKPSFRKALNITFFNEIRKPIMEPLTNLNRLIKISIEFILFSLNFNTGKNTGT